ncbi:hypothetical protein DERP_010213 [Dermatophagoides pteronyssinus]|uniref:Uncharacterized protein n=1 Tax=Dermatophagoides pteronyssinus TaxID=6956 RepID=A0ABQ8J7K2_DERPT|nr:hypothetical protein DERP_010213 [Dermatophagoides pteronyssinus]
MSWIVERYLECHCREYQASTSSMTDTFVQLSIFDSIQDGIFQYEPVDQKVNRPKKLKKTGYNHQRRII